jgi:hypothetical protein
MATHRLPVLGASEAATRGRIKPTVLPALRGSGPDQWACGGCGAVLVEGAPFPIRLMNGAVICPQCGAVNDVDFPANTNPATA